MSNEHSHSEAEDFFSGSAKAFQFDKIGDTCTGEIIEMVKRQQTSLSDGQKLFWDDGSPRMMLVITVQTDEVSDDEYKEFYKHIAHDWNDPLTHLTTTIEGTMEAVARV